MKVLQVNKKAKFIFIKLKKFCKKYEINIKYTILYLYKKKRLVE